MASLPQASLAPRTAQRFHTFKVLFFWLLVFMFDLAQSEDLALRRQLERTEGYLGPKTATLSSNDSIKRADKLGKILSIHFYDSSVRAAKAMVEVCTWRCSICSIKTPFFRIILSLSIYYSFTPAIVCLLIVQCTALSYGDLQIEPNEKPVQADLQEEGPFFLIILTENLVRHDLTPVSLHLTACR